MGRIESSLTRLEATLRGIIEWDAGDVPRKFHRQLMQALDKAMHLHLDHGGGVAPDQYILVMPEEQAKMLLAAPHELDRLARELAESAREEGLKMPALPMLRVVASPEARDIEVYTKNGRGGVDDSSTTELEQANGLHRSEEGEQLRAFLIVNGLSTFPLVQAITNVGSDPLNNLVLRDGGVSPAHAQLRFINHRFTIFDLGSKNGSFVNGVKISSQVLSPGDVILLGGVPLVYGQEQVVEEDYTQKLDSAQPPLEIL
jgi:hypothetical protein